MYDINSKDTIYFGTKLENIYTLDKTIVRKPFVKDEKYISVSSYRGKLPISCHEDISYLSRIFTDKFKASMIDEKNYIKWKNGYKNSLTYIDGFGPNENQYYNEFGKDITNTRVGENIAAIIDKKYISELIIPDKLCNFKYLSTSLHSYIKKITPEMVIGWIADSNNIERIRYDMRVGNLRNNNIYLVDEI